MWRDLFVPEFSFLAFELQDQNLVDILSSSVKLIYGIIDRRNNNNNEKNWDNADHSLIEDSENKSAGDLRRLIFLNSQWVALNINQWSCNLVKKSKFGMKVKIRKGQFLLFKFKTHQFLRSYNILEKEICVRNFVLFMKTVWMTDGIYIKWQKLLNYKRWATEIKKDQIN